MKSSKHSTRLPTPPLPPPRRRAFLLITVLLPLVLLGALELLLRLFHYGPDLSLFTTIDVAGKTYHVMNPLVKGRYFTNDAFSPASSQELFLVPKPAGTYRIFCLGGSTMVGYPYWYNGAPSTFLRDRLQKIFPSRKIEIINVGMTATNSFTVADLARDLTGYEPDLLVVYDGHNEFYGALGVASHETLGGYLWPTRLYLKLLQWRTFLLVRDGVARAAQWFGGSPPPAITLMEQLARGKNIPYGSPLYHRGLEAFRANITSLREMCASRSIPVILSTQVSALRTQPPFVSGDPDAGDSARLRALLDSAQSMEAVGNHPGALATLRAARDLDSLRAETNYLIGQCLYALGDYSGARRSYTQARDYDQLRFRASSDFNDVIRTAESSGTFVADVERLFAAHSPDSLTGSELIFEHLHPRARGYFLIAKEYAALMRRHGLIAPAGEWSVADTLDEDALWESRPITALDSIIAERRTATLTSHWPFVLHQPTAPTERPAGPLESIAGQVLRGALTWEYGHVAAAEWYERGGDFDRAAREYRALINQYPRIVSAYLRLARVYQALHLPSEAEGTALQSLGVERTPRALRILGTIANNDRRFPEAIRRFEQAMALETESEGRKEDACSLALVYFNAGMKDRALETVRGVLGADPSYLQARKLLRQIAGPQK